MAANELKKALFEEFQKNGITKKQIKISARFSMYDECATITIHDLTLPKNKVEEIATAFESYERDQRSGEILQGGNTFIRVEYDYDKWQEQEKSHEEQAQNIIATKAQNEGVLNPIFENDNRFLINKDCFVIRSKNEQKRYNDPTKWEVMRFLTRYHLGHFEPIEEYEIWKAEETIKEQKQMEEYKKQQEESQRLGELWRIKRQENQNIIKDESRLFELEENHQFFLNGARWANCNKNATINEYKEQCFETGEYYRHNAKVTNIWKFESWRSWEALTESGLLTDYEQIKGLGGSETLDEIVKTIEDYYKMTREQRETVKWFNLVILAYFEESAILIDPQGHSYCRYVALFDGYAEGKQAAKQAAQVLHDGEYTNR